jgi:hypothetical protein
MRDREKQRKIYRKTRGRGMEINLKVRENSGRRSD